MAKKKTLAVKKKEGEKPALSKYAAKRKKIKTAIKEKSTWQKESTEKPPAQGGNEENGETIHGRSCYRSHIQGV